MVRTTSSNTCESTSSHLPSEPFLELVPKDAVQFEKHLRTTVAAYIGSDHIVVSAILTVLPCLDMLLLIMLYT